MPELVSAKKLAEARGAGGELRPPAGGPGPEEARRRMRREAAEMSARGMPMGAIAAALGKSKTTVHRWLKGAGGG
jgi:DNA invertase Pin-like site-specific DNA recombinase